MTDFINLVNNALAEKNKTTADLFNDSIVFKDTFYKYRHRYPSVCTLLKISNYLKVTPDYLLELSDENDYREAYTFDSEKFYLNLTKILKSKNMSGRIFCKELNYSKDNLLRWKKGTVPSTLNLIQISSYFEISISDLLL